MSWSDDHGRHEGYLLPEFADGVRGLDTSGIGLPHDQVIVDVAYVGEPGATREAHYATRPAAEVVGWRIMCACRLNEASSAVSDRWVSELLTRVPSKALEDVVAGHIFATDPDVADVDADTATFEVLVDWWRREHVDGLDAVELIQAAAKAVVEAELRLDASVAVARSTGATWEVVGQAAGIPRRSARTRWGKPTPERQAEFNLTEPGSPRRSAPSRPLAALHLVPVADQIWSPLARPDLAEAGEIDRAARAAKRRERSRNTFET